MSQNTLKDASSVKLNFDLSFQKTYAQHEQPLPLVITNVSHKTVESVSHWLSQNSSQLENILVNYGAILFRGFPLENSDNFRDFVSAFPNWSDLPYEDSLSYAVRMPVCARVCTTNEGKTGGMVFHHEQAQAPKFPSKLLFFCERPADVGGGTAICPSDVVLHRIQEKYPGFIKECEGKKVKYWANLPRGQDSSKGVGRGWTSFFGCEGKEEVEKRMRELGYTWKWLGGESDPTALLQTCTPLLPAVVNAPGSNRRVFFNQMIARFIGNARDFQFQVSNSASGKTAKKELDINDYLVFGDGSEVNAEALEFGNEVCEETAVEIMWEKGDVLLIDNFQVMHARRTFEGPRRVLASLVQ